MPPTGSWDGIGSPGRPTPRTSRSMVPIGSPRMKHRYALDAVTDDWGKLPEEQEDLVSQFRDALVKQNAYDPEKHAFPMLLRFLRARDYDVDRAVSMFLDMLQWRQENRIDYILDEFDFTEREEFLSVFPQGYHKTDKQGHPVYIQHLGRVDLQRIREVTTEERWLKYHVQEWERCMRDIFPICSKLYNRQIDSTFAVIDVKGVGFYHLTKEVRNAMAEITKIDSDNYPETLFHTCIINAPTAFRAMFSMIKPMLNKRTQGKIEVCPKDYMSVLRKWIDEDSIPEYLGGKSKGTLIDDCGPWRPDPLVKELEMEPLGETDEERLTGRQASTLSNTTVYEDAETSPEWTSCTSDDRTQDDAASGVFSGLDPPTTAIDTPSRASSLAARIRKLENRFPQQVERLKTHMSRDAKERLADVSSAPRGSLMGRVEVLEESMELLLGAQERSWEELTTTTRGSGYCTTCSCCSIM